jgi:hypothetical protein
MAQISEYRISKCCVCGMNENGETVATILSAKKNLIFFQEDPKFPTIPVK